MEPRVSSVDKIRRNINRWIGVHGLLLEGRFFTHALPYTNSTLIRSFESSPCDGAIARLQNFMDVNTDMTERMFELFQRWSRRSLVGAKFIPFDVKSVSPSFNTQDLLDGHPIARWVIPLTGSLLHEAQFIIVITNTCPEWVALIPIEYFPDFRTRAASQEHLAKSAFMLAAMTAAEGALCQAPPSIYPFMLPYHTLGIAFERILQLAEAPGSTTYINPWSGIQFNKMIVAFQPYNLRSHSPSCLSSTQRLLAIFHAISSSDSDLKMELLVKPQLLEPAPQLIKTGDTYGRRLYSPDF